MTVLTERVHWRTAAPLWPAAAEGALDLARPAILRFASDDFMERVQGVLTAGGEGLDDFLARSETWREPRAGLPLDRDLANPMKLFQPLQGRFYLVSATLVCSKRGLPDRAVEPARAESAFFLLRQLRRASAQVDVDPSDPSTFTEHAWIPGAAGSGAWQPAPAVGVAPDEQRLPLFGVSYEALGARRQLLAGLIPVAAREALRAAPALPASPGDDPLAGAVNPRLAPLLPVIEGLSAIFRVSGQASLPAMREAILFGALDLAEAVTDSQAEKVAVFTQPDGFIEGSTWGAALDEAREYDTGETIPPIPQPFSQLANAAAIRAALGTLGIDGARAPGSTAVFEQIRDTLPASTSTSTPLVMAAAAAPADPLAEDDAVLVARCGYERPHCPPEARLRLSPPSVPFVFASLYDPDAPVRPATIPMPNDLNLATLRRSPKGVSVALSQELRRQLNRFQDMKISALEAGNVGGAPPLAFGMVCQLSIPIITICALILLLIIVALLNIVFFWLPFFKICLPSVRRG